MLRAASVPLLTLTGPGGVGKTRLALAVAHALADEFAGGVSFVSLAPVLNPAHVPFTVARALGVQDARGTDLLTQVAAVLGGRELLLVLDNFEHVLLAAQWVSTFLEMCPNVTVLATSRERLRISGEQEMPVLPLALPARATPLSFDLLSQCAAIRLFTVRAAASDPAFSLTRENVSVVAEICRRLDGLPLAIELAATHIKALPPSALLTRLERRLPLLVGGSRDAPARHQTLRGTITWSHDLLSDDEQVLLRRMAVFAGGFTLESAEVVSEAADDTLRLVALLVDRSLLGRMDNGTGEPRFRMLETIREFAWERLIASGEEADTRHRHAMWCIALAERCDFRNCSSAEVRLRLDCLEAERDNVRAALAWLLDSGAIEAALHLAAAYHFLWLHRGPVREGRAWVSRSLAAPDNPPSSPAIRGLAAQAASILAWMEGAFDEAAALAADSLVLAREGGADADCVWSLNLLGMAATSLGRFDEAATYLDSALELYRHLGAGRSPSIILTNRAVVSDPVAARGYLDQALALCRRNGAQASQLVIVLNELGRLACVEENGVEAGQWFGESLHICWSSFNLWSLPKALEGLACVAVSTARPATAVRLLAAASTVRERTGAPVMVADRGYYDHIVQRCRQHLPPADFAAAWDQGRAMLLEDVVAEALILADASGNPAESHVADVRRDGGTGDSGEQPFGLSPRECEVLSLLCQRLTDAEIGEALSISPRTASRHVANLFNKLGVSSRRAAEAIAVKHHLT
jgi:predicted ATPase/DNA-binding CsgD family transcriptional regulator